MSRTISNSDRIPEIKTLADCRAIYQRFFPSLYIEGKEHSRCAFHEDKGPSLKIQKDSCYCFGACKHAYDAIDLYAKGADCSKAEAIDLLAKELGIASGNGNGTGSRQRGDGTKPKQGKSRDYAKEFEQALKTSPPAAALAWFERYGLTSILPELQKDRLIGFKPANETYADTLVIPATNLNRKILGLQYIPCDGGKKMFASGTEPGTYKDQAFLVIYRRNDRIIITEGAKDCFCVAAAIPTANVVSIFSAGFVEKVGNFSSDEELPVLFLDRDEAGKKATAEAVRILRGRCFIVDWSQAPEDCKDPGDLLAKGHTELINKMVREAKRWQGAIPQAIEPAATCDSNSSSSDGQEWGSPSELTTAIPPAPPFPLECLPYRVANYVIDEADRMQSPVDLVAVPIIITFAGLIGKEATFRPKRLDDWSERPCLWSAVIAPPAAMKSQNQSKATAPLRRIQTKLAEEDKARQEKWKKEASAVELRLKAWEKQCSNLLRRDPDAVLPPKPKAAEDLPAKPGPRRIVSNDATIEKLADMMVNSRGMTLIRDELAGFLLNMQRYHNGSDRQFYLEAYSGGSFAVDRMMRGEMWIDDLYLNIVGGIQPEVARKLLSSESGSHDGFFERFGLTIYPEPVKEYVHVDRRPNKQMRDLFNELCDKLACANWKELLFTDEFTSKPYARFNDEAQEIFDSWLVDHMRQIRSIPEGDPTSGMLGKARGLLVRLVLTLHLAAWAGGEISDPKTVEKQSLQRGIRLLEEYLTPMWRRVFAAFGKSAADSGATRIARYILDQKACEVRIRDILQKSWKGLKINSEVEDALDILIEHDWLGEPSKLSKGGSRGGRKTSVYPVNPKVFEKSGKEGESQK